jgi:hypothetical protein
MKWKISAICLHLSHACHSFVHWILVMSFNSLESCMFIWLYNLTFFSFSTYAEVWRVRLDWMLQWRLSLAWRSHIWFHSFTLYELNLLIDLTLRSWITCISLLFEHLIACDESWLCHSVFWSWLTSALCSWYQAKQWVNTSLNWYSYFSLICIVLLFEFFWTASNDTCVLCMHWINSSILRSVLQDSLKALCLKYLKHSMLCLLLLIWLSASLHLLWCMNWMRLSEIWMILRCRWHSLEKMRKRTFLAVSWFFSRTSLLYDRCRFTSVMKTEKAF